VTKMSNAEIESIRAQLLALPPAPTATVKGTKAATVASLAPELLGLRRQGYGLAALAAFLTEKGLPIASGTLKNYLQRAGVARGKRRGTKLVDARSANAPHSSDTALAGVAPSSPPRTGSSEQRAPNQNVRLSAWAARPDIEDI
jgi:hypothetical protein